MPSSRPILAGVAAALAASLPAGAQIVDPVGDFIPTFGGSPNADIDVLSAQVIFEAPTSTVRILAEMNANIGSLTPNGLYVFGFDRGAGTVGFPIQASNVVFDSVVILRADTSATISRFGGGGVTNFGAGTVTLNGRFLEAAFPISELPSRGFTPSQYTWNLWSRDPSAAGLAALADFAPNNSNVLVTTAPEPGSLWLAAVGVAVIAIRKRRRA